MNKIISIAAISPEGLLAIDGKMPWNIEEDLTKFSLLTQNNTVVMGRKTWESLGKKCLKNRINYVVTRKINTGLISGTSALIAPGIDEAISDSQLRYPLHDIFIIGGNEIYKQTMLIWDEIYLTIIKKEFINYTEGIETYLSVYYKDIDTIFEEVSSIETKYATYKKYKRRVTIKVNKERLFYS
jgi:dihydrofolate reductase